MDVFPQPSRRWELELKFKMSELVVLLPPTGVLMYTARSSERGIRGKVELNVDLPREEKKRVTRF